MRKAWLPLLAVFVVAPQSASACNEDGYKVLYSGDRIPTATCQSKLFARVARAHGVRISAARIRNDPVARDWICDLVGWRGRLQVACALHDYDSRRRW